MTVALSESSWQVTFPVVDQAGAIVGMIAAPSITGLVSESGIRTLAVAADLMEPPVTATPQDDLRKVIELLVNSDVRQLPVVEQGRLVGFIDESHVARAHLALLGGQQPS
jgi:CIC family chloride channel protein